MSKKPNFLTDKEKRLLEAKYELDKEKGIKEEKTVQTSLVVDANLLYAIKEIALKRKQTDKKPDTVSGIMREALKEILSREVN